MTQEHQLQCLDLDKNKVNYHKDYIERHITLDRANWGTDQAASLAEAGIDNLTSLLRKIPLTVGDGKKKFLKEEKNVSKKMRYWEQI